MASVLLSCCSLPVKIIAIIVVLLQSMKQRARTTRKLLPPPTCRVFPETILDQQGGKMMQEGKNKKHNDKIWKKVLLQGEIGYWQADESLYLKNFLLECQEKVEPRERTRSLDAPKGVEACIQWAFAVFVASIDARS